MSLDDQCLDVLPLSYTIVPEICNFLLSSRFDGQTPLHFSVYSEDPIIINLLIDCDSNIMNVMDEQGHTALHLAVCLKSYKVADLLVKRGIDVNLGLDGNTPLCLAVKNNDMKISKLLLAAGATKVDYVFKSGVTLLHVAVGMNNMDITRRILDKGVDVNACGENGFTALHQAVSVGHYSQVALLLERGADLNAKFRPQVYISSSIIFIYLHRSHLYS